MTKTFSPTVSDTLETRSVPSSLGLSASHAFVFTHGALTTPVVHPPGVFSNGTPTLRTATNGERFFGGGAPLNTVVTKAPVLTTTPSATPAVTPPVTPSGPSVNNTPTLRVSTNGETFFVGHFGR